MPNINIDIKKRTKYFVRTLFVLSFFSVIIFGLLLNAEQSQAEIKSDQPKIDHFADLKLEAKAVLVWDTGTKHPLFAQNADASLPLASLTKVMTAITASQVLDQNETIVIEASDLLPEGDSGLKVGDRWRAQELIDFVLVTSSNDGARALARASNLKTGSTPDFITKMNETAGFIGANNSRFANEHGLDQDAQNGGAYGSARDVSLIFEYALKRFPSLLEATRYKNLSLRSSASVYDAVNTNSRVNEIPGLLASKTGYTDLAGGNLVIAFDAGLQRPIIVAVLGSSQEGRFVDTLKLVEASLKTIQEQNP